MIACSSATALSTAGLLEKVPPLEVRVTFGRPLKATPATAVTLQRPLVRKALLKPTPAKGATDDSRISPSSCPT